MVHRERVAEERGRRWINGGLTSEEYFRSARREARERARKVVSAQLKAAGRPLLSTGR